MAILARDCYPVLTRASLPGNPEDRQARYIEAAGAAAESVLESMRSGDRLARSWRAGRMGPPGYSDDMASMAAACLALWETTFDARWIEHALSLARALVRDFADERGGFFQSAADAGTPLARPKALFDNAIPAGNSLAADVLQRLGLLTGDAELEKAGVSALRAVRDLAERAPTGFGTALSALDLYLGPTRELAVVGSPELRRPLLEVAWSAFRPRLVMAAAEAGQAPVAVEQIKKVSAMGDLDEGIEAEKGGFVTAFSSEDAREGISAFLGKRKPKWQGK